MNRPARRSILAVGVPGTGKTALHVRITDAAILRPGYDGVFVLDRNEEWSASLDRYVGDLEAQLEALDEDEARVREAVKARGWDGYEVRQLDGPIVRSAEEYKDCCALLATMRRSSSPLLTPRRTIWRCGRDPKLYGEALREAVDQGHMWLVFSESPDWFTNYERDWPFDAIPGRDVRLSQLYSQGRAHIKNRHGEPCPIHILTDSQDLAMVHWKVRKFSSIVLMSRIEGGESYATLRREFGDGTDSLANRVRRLKPHEWIAVRGEMPELAPYSRGGR